MRMGICMVCKEKGDHPSGSHSSNLSGTPKSSLQNSSRTFG